MQITSPEGLQASNVLSLPSSHLNRQMIDHVVQTSEDFFSQLKDENLALLHQTNHFAENSIKLSEEAESIIGAQFTNQELNPFTDVAFRVIKEANLRQSANNRRILENTARKVELDHMNDLHDVKIASEGNLILHQQREISSLKSQLSDRDLRHFETAQSLHAKFRAQDVYQEKLKNEFYEKERERKKYNRQRWYEQEEKEARDKDRLRHKKEKLARKEKELRRLQIERKSLKERK